MWLVISLLSNSHYIDYFVRLQVGHGKYSEVGSSPEPISGIQSRHRCNSPSLAVIHAKSRCDSALAATIQRASMKGSVTWRNSGQRWQSDIKARKAKAIIRENEPAAMRFMRTRWHGQEESLLRVRPWRRGNGVKRRACWDEYWMWEGLVPVMITWSVQYSWMSTADGNEKEALPSAPQFLSPTLWTTCKLWIIGRFLTSSKSLCIQNDSA